LFHPHKGKTNHVVRKLLVKMNIKVTESNATRTQSICCGDSFCGVIPVAQVKEQMKKRSHQMPCEDVVVIFPAKRNHRLFRNKGMQEAMV
jgi:hypothetical protein